MGAPQRIQKAFDRNAALVAWLTENKIETLTPLYELGYARRHDHVALTARWNPSANGGSGGVEVRGRVDFTKMDGSQLDATELVEVDSPTVSWNDGLVLSDGGIFLPSLPGSLGSSAPKMIYATMNGEIVDPGTPSDGDCLGCGWANASNAIAMSGIWYDGATNVRWEGALIQGTIASPTQTGSVPSLGVANVATEDFNASMLAEAATATTGFRRCTIRSADYNSGTGLLNDAALPGALSAYVLGASGPATKLALICQGAQTLTVKSIDYGVIL